MERWTKWEGQSHGGKLVKLAGPWWGPWSSPNDPKLPARNDVCQVEAPERPSSATARTNQMSENNTASAEVNGGTPFAARGYAACEATLRDEHKTKCRLRAISAIVEHGDYVPVCPRHAEIARSMGWKMGALAEAHGSDARSQLKAKMAGACAALEGKTIAANAFAEDSELHFCWLYGWTEAKLEMHPNAAGERLPAKNA